jgi:3-(3-hydroxy-phenyl)propionate hydroxylase
VFDVAIVGFGPIGALLANLLGQRGLTVLVLEKDADVYPLPRAVHFDGEVMRVFESVGLRTEVEAISRSGLLGMHFVNADNKTLLVRGGGNAIGPHGCATNYYFHQPELECVLRAGVNRFKNVTVELKTEVLSIQQKNETVEIETNDHVTPIKFARYVVGCDGARSIVRKTMSSAMEDLGLDQPWLVFDVLLNREIAQLPSYTVQHCDPKRPMTYCNVTGLRRRWEIMLMPGDDPQEIIKPVNIWRLVNRWIKPDQASIERVAIYTFHSIIAKGWRKNNLLIAGDAAHQMPPFLGQGMCAGIRDAANLAWKLQAVLEGKRADSLLDTFEQERSPHVKDFVALAVKIGDIIQITDPVKAAQRDAKFLQGAPEVFHFPTPRFSNGMVLKSSSFSGQIFPQPKLDDESLMDEVTGDNFVVMGNHRVISEVNETTKNLWKKHGVKKLLATDRSVHNWLAEQKVLAVMLRPDRYIFGTANTSEELNALTQSFEQMHSVQQTIPRNGIPNPPNSADENLA